MMKYTNNLHKLYPTKKQETFLDMCLWSAVGIENWAIQQIKDEIDEKTGIPLKFLKPKQLRSILSHQIDGHSTKCGLPSKLLNDCIGAVLKTFARHKNIHRVHWKSIRRKNSYYFTGDIKFDKNDRLKIPGLKTTIKMSQPGEFTGKLKKVVLIKKFDGWYACCSYQQERQPINIIDGKEAGIDPGLKTSLVFSDGTEIQFPKFYQDKQKLITKQQRKSKNSKKLKRTHKKTAAKRKDHHHKLTTDLAKEYAIICWSSDNFKGLVRMYGKQYSNYAFGKFRDLLEHKLASRADGFGKLIKVKSKKSTMTCCVCGAETGPTGIDGLEVREWVCTACGAVHDRDINAATNTYNWGKAMSSEKGNHSKTMEIAWVADEPRESRATPRIECRIF